MIPMNTPLLLEQYLVKKQQIEQLEAEIKQIQKAILEDPEFEKAEINWKEIRKEVRTTYAFIEASTIPEGYKKTEFNLGLMLQKEPSTWARIQRQLMVEYPDYVLETADYEKLQKDHPELFDLKKTEYLKVITAKPKASTEPF